ncbi:MAG: nickel pincer cofactor biosynthesis protein LarC [Ignavibacteriales bacterium]|nr:nickel pincer cofactor biosynthesis protein LarC [Ignavibacteriales bacterium]
MRIAYFDTLAGISGDMTLGAFLSAGVPLDVLINELKKLNVSGYEVSAAHIKRNGIGATKVDVVISDAPSYHRHLSNINAIIENSSLSATVQGYAKKIFYEVAVAEAAVHSSTVEKVHFHEVGAIDSIVDIVGTAICLEQLGIERVYSSPVKVGSGGVVHTQHGTMPVPTPATMEILKGYPIVLSEIPFELTTPTGAAIIKALSAGTMPFEQIRIRSIGYGAGTRELQAIPNLLRLIIGDIADERERDEVLSIETNIDDMNPEILPYVIEKLMGAGALDAFLIPIVMKKGRSAHLLSVLAGRETLDAMLGILFQETSTLGVRIQHVERRKLPRSQRQVHTSLGTMTVKSVTVEGHERLIPEFEECRRIAIEKNIPLTEVYKILEFEIRK